MLAYLRQPLPWTTLRFLCLPFLAAWTRFQLSLEFKYLQIAAWSFSMSVSECWEAYLYVGEIAKEGGLFLDRKIFAGRSHI